MTDGNLAAEARKAREAAHLSQAELAARAGVSSQTIWRLEGGRPIAADSVRAVAAALGIDAATLPPRPAQSTMPSTGDTDPHWRDLSCRLAESGERILASEPADVERYRAVAAGARPPAVDGHRTIQRIAAATRPDMEVWLILAILALAGVALAVQASHLADLRGLVTYRAYAALTLSLSAASAAPFVRAWLLNAPVRRHDRHAAGLAARLAAERYVVTDRAAYVVARAPDGHYAWRRMGLPAASTSRRPVDEAAPGMDSLTLRDGSGAFLDLLAPLAGGDVEAALAR